MITSNRVATPDFISNPLADKSIFETEITGGLVGNTFQLLWEKLTSLQSTDEKEYIDEAENAMAMAPKIDAIEQLLCHTKPSIIKPLADIHEFILRTFISHGTDAAKIKQDIIFFFSANIKKTEKHASPQLAKPASREDQLKNEKHKRQLTLEAVDKTISDFKQQLETVWVKNYRVKDPTIAGRFRNTYYFEQEKFFIYLAKAFFTQANIESLQKQFNQHTLSLNKKITQLKNSLNTDAVDDPSNNMDKLFQKYTKELNESVEDYKKHAFQHTLNTRISDLKTAATTIVTRYKANIDRQIKNIEGFPENLEKKLRAALTSCKKENREQVLDSKTEMFYEDLKKKHAVLKKVLHNELQIKTNDNLRPIIVELLENPDTFSTNIDPHQIRSPEQAAREIDNLEISHNDTTKIYNKTYKKIEEYETDLNNLSKEVEEYPKLLNEKGLPQLRNFLEKRQTTFIAFYAAITAMTGNNKLANSLKERSHFDTSDKKQDAVLQGKIKTYLTSIIEELRTKLKEVEHLFTKKSLSLQHLLEKETPTSSKPISIITATKDPALTQKALTAVPDQLKLQAVKYKTEMKKLQEKVIKDLSTTATQTIQDAWTTTLSLDFKQGISHLITELESKKLDDALKKKIKSIEAYKEKLLHDFCIEQAKQQHTNAEAERKKQEKELEDATLESQKSRLSDSPIPFATAEKRKLVVKHHLAKSVDEEMKSHNLLNIALQAQTKATKSSLIGAIIAAIIIPVSMTIGAVEIYREISAQHHSQVMGFFAGFFSFITCVYSAYRGIKRIYTGKSESNKDFSQPDIQLNTFINDKPEVPISHIALPPIDSLFIDDIKTCIETQLNETEKRRYILTQPKKLYLNEENKLFLQSEDKLADICFSDAAAQFILRTLTLIKKPEDFRINMEHKDLFVSVEIGKPDSPTQYSLHPHASNNSNLVYSLTKIGGRSRECLLPEQFEQDNKLLELLYPVTTSMKKPFFSTPPLPKKTPTRSVESSPIQPRKKSRSFSLS